MFTSIGSSYIRLKSCGVTTRLPHTSVLLFARLSVIKGLCACIIHFHTGCKNRQLNDVLHGRAAISLNHWGTSKAFDSKSLMCALAASVHRFHTALPSAFAMESVCSMFRCPAGHLRLATYPFVPQLQHKSIWCSQCQTAIRSKLWRCQCLQSWHDCPLHGVITAKHSILAGVPTGKRSSSSTPKVSSAIDHLMRLEPDRPYSRPMLGPILSRRFPRLVATTSSSSTSSCKG